MAKLNTHITLNGNCEEAFNFYKSIFGGEFDILMRNKDIPKDVAAPPGADPNKILYIALPISAETVLMGCDMPEAYGEAILGNSYNIFIGTDSRDETFRIFNSLSEGGKVSMPLADTFWGAYFAMFTDIYGIKWMVSYDQQPQS